MEIWEEKTLAGQEHVLSDSELTCIRNMLKRSRQSKNEWDDLKGLLKEKMLFTIQPMDKNLSSRFCFEGILQDGGALLVFTSLEECEEYGKRHAAVRMGKNYSISTIPCENVLNIAATYGKDVYIDVTNRPDDRFLVYDGKAKSLHLCIVKGK